MLCLNLLSVGVRMDSWNDWQELPACSNSLKSCSVALQHITNEMSVYQKQPANACLNNPCSTDAEIQCKLLSVLRTGSCNNDGVHIFFLRSLEFWLLQITISHSVIIHRMGGRGLAQLSNLFNMWGWFFFILDFLPCHLESSIAPEI